MRAKLLPFLAVADWRYLRAYQISARVKKGICCLQESASGKLLGSIINSVGSEKGGKESSGEVLVARVMLLDGKRGWRRPREKAAGRER
jgi:hypothetical protein